jgi:hypothetical protein
MSNARAVRYRRLALATDDKAIAALLLKLADECDGYMRHSSGPSKKVQIRLQALILGYRATLLAELDP